MKPKRFYLPSNMLPASLPACCIAFLMISCISLLSGGFLWGEEKNASNNAQSQDRQYPSVQRLREKLKTVSGKQKVGVLIEIGLEFTRKNIPNKNVEVCQEALELARGIGDTEGEVRALNQIVVSYTTLGRFPEAEALCRESLRICERTGDRRNQALALHLLGNLYGVSGDHNEALAAMMKSLELWKQLENLQWTGDMLMNIGVYFISSGKYLKAKEYLFEAVDIFKKTDDKKKMGMAYINIGTACSNLKQFKAALENYR
ncbi:MAG: tetratricopeptide repeat protein, partial [bacterium]|nr:tetratricopeptide repeat protein [bacterium]